MIIYCWCIMPSHLHLIFRAADNNPSDVLRDFKHFTSTRLLKAIQNNPKESRREWMLAMFEEAGKKNSNNFRKQFWQQHNHPIELWSNAVIDQKANYTHYNPVVAGFVNEPEDWRYSSAIDYADGKGLVKVELL